MSSVSKYTPRQFLSFGRDMGLLKNVLIDGVIPLFLPFSSTFSLLSFSPFLICNFITHSLVFSTFGITSVPV